MFQNFVGELAGRCHVGGGGIWSKPSRQFPRNDVAALGALASSGALIRVDGAWGQISETLPEVTVTAPRSAPPPPRRVKPAPRRAAALQAPTARERAPAPAPAATVPSPFQFVAPTPITGLGIDRNKVPAMVQLPASGSVRWRSIGMLGAGLVTEL